MPSNTIIVETSALKDAMDRARKLAVADINVCILAESGCGKELLARYIHDLSNRSDGVFVAVNCGGLDGNLVRDELFGHVKGAFTGAYKDLEGVFERAKKGTVFLDEIGDLPLAVQPQLLRVLQDKKIQRIGSDTYSACDFRLVVATNCDLKSDVENGKFRHDLYQRITSATIRIPPLRDRREDIPLLIKHFLEKLHVTCNDDSVWHPLNDYDWPGNVRELEGFVGLVAALYATNVIRQENVAAELKIRRTAAPRPGDIPKSKNMIAATDIDRLRPYMKSLGFPEDASTEPVAALASYLETLSRDHRLRFLGKGCRISEDSILLLLTADAIALTCAVLAEARGVEALAIADKEFGMHRMKEKSTADLAVLERAVVERLKRL